MPSTLSMILTSCFPSARRAARLKGLEDKATEAEVRLEQQTKERAEKNDQTRTDMSCTDVQGSRAGG